MQHRTLRATKLASLMAAVTGASAIATGAPTPAAPAGSTARPDAVAGTSVLDPNVVLAGLPEPGWFKTNIPLLEVPDGRIQQVYYYRWGAYKRHLRYTTPSLGYTVTEFVHGNGNTVSFGAINAAAGHHIYEGRWVKSPQYMDDYEAYWMTGPGRTPTSGFDTGGINAAHQYSFWAADAYYARYLVNGDAGFLTAQQANLVRQYNEWSGNFDSARGLYWQFPVWDASEYTISSYQTTDPYHGGKGFRPTLNSYQWADALAISRIATLAGDTATAADFAGRAASLKTNLQARLWDPGRSFFLHMMTDNAAQGYASPEGTLLDGREYMGFIPWMFNLPDGGFSSAWSQIMDPQGFYAAFGPRTAERRHRLYGRDVTAGCCRWDAPQWPFATSQILTAMANLLDNYSQSVVTRDNYFTVLLNYTLAQFKAGQPYVAEAADPDTGTWIYDAFNSSAHYNHSTYADLVITGLIGVRPRADDTFEVAPLVPASWPYFALENVLYHGHLMTVLWDSTGSRYGKGSGLRIFQDGVQIGFAPTLTRLAVAMASRAPVVRPPHRINNAANPVGTGFPQGIASFTWQDDRLTEALDGIITYDDIPDNRWTAYQSPNASDWFGVDFGGNRTVAEVRMYLYDDGGGVQKPISYDLQSWNGTSWASIPGQLKTPATPSGRDVNIVSFTPLTTSRVRVVFVNGAGKPGLTELEAWDSPVGGGGSPGVTFYQDINFGGLASLVKGPGDYPALPADIPNDWMSSLRIPAGWRVDAFNDGNFGGNVCTFTADTPRVGAGCNDVMSSFRIRAP
jgi:hypothetical protein